MDADRLKDIQEERVSRLLVGLYDDGTMDVYADGEPLLDVICKYADETHERGAVDEYIFENVRLVFE